MTFGDIMYYDLLGVVLVATADIFHLWEPFANGINSFVARVRSRR